jgi:hypothetical protein
VRNERTEAADGNELPFNKGAPVRTNLISWNSVARLADTLLQATRHSAIQVNDHSSIAIWAVGKMYPGHAWKGIVPWQKAGTVSRLALSSRRVKPSGVPGAVEDPRRKVMEQ